MVHFGKGNGNEEVPGIIIDISPKDKIMIQFYIQVVIREVKFKEQLPEDIRIRFRDFKHDIITIPTSDLKYNPYSTVVSSTATHTSIVPTTWLDHVLSKVPLQASIYEVEERVSDHYPLIIEF
jgi:hypothetical protein